MNKQEIIKLFQNQFPHSKKPIIIKAPGRVNLIGEHTDYNDGFVLPMAINSNINVAGSLRNDNQVHMYSADYQVYDQFLLSDIKHSTAKEKEWSNYIKGICLLFQKQENLKGMNILIQGNVPQGAGLSSSAALEVGTALLIKNLHGFTTTPVEMIKLAQKAENEFVGVQCGIMDQFISMLGAKNHALFLDCKTLDYQLVPTPFNDIKVVVVNSGVKRGLVDSEYNKRRQQCNDAVKYLQEKLPDIQSLRDVSTENLPLINALPEELAKRARHVVTENQRVIDATKALTEGELQLFGDLMNKSHVSLKDDYEVSCQELDLLVELALSIPETIGSRMTGAGFGGCTVSIVHSNAVDEFQDKVTSEYQKLTNIKPEIFIFDASRGASQLK